MTYNAEKLIEKINKLGFHAFAAKSGFALGAVALVSAEHGDDAADYYGEFRGGYPWVNPKIEAFAKENSCEIQWINPGCIGLFPA